ncbi:MAG: cytochrome B6 [Desulfuromonadaceae bacterium]|nr:cytochrome B6 [Desulfuromonadaceae bacterium]
MKNYVKSDPTFFRLIKGAMAATVLVTLVLAALFPAPLMEPADVSRVPNPSRAAWFLIWMQEVVSYSKYAIYAVAALGLIFCLLPWLPVPEAKRACWWPREQRWVNWLALGSFMVIVALTLVAFYFRGGNWSLVWPW